MKKSKKYIDASKLYDKTAVYEFEEAVALVKKMACIYIFLTLLHYKPPVVLSGATLPPKCFYS